MPLRQQQLGVENRRSGGAPDRVVAQRHEAVPQHAVPGDPAHADAHAAPGVAIEPRLRTVGLVAHHNGPCRRAGKVELLGQRGEGVERVAQVPRLRRFREPHPHCRHVPVHHVHPMALRAHREIRWRHAATVQAPENLARLPLDLFLLVRDEGHHVVGDVEGGDPRVSRARERLQRGDDYGLDAEASGANASAIITVEQLGFVTMKPCPERALSSARWSGLTSGTSSGTPSSMRWDDELLITGYPAWANRVSIGPATSAGKPENTRSHARGGSGAWTTRAAAVGGTSPGSRQVHASAYGLPCERSDAASAVTTNWGWRSSSCRKRWPTAPVAPRIPTRIFAMDPP